MSHPRWALAACILGSSMAFIDGTVVNVALPVLQSQLHATISDAQWIVNAYLLVLSSLILVGGSLGDRFGRVRIYGFGVALFTCGSLLCGLAPGLTLLTVARVIQGIGAALLVPGSLAIITDVYSPSERGKAIGIWSALTAIATIAGPPLGGALVQALSWRAVFFINIPLGVIVLWMVVRHVPGHPGVTDGPIDWRGALFVTMGLAALTWSLIEAPARSRGVVAIAAIAGVLCLVAFIVVERRAAAPLIPLSMFRSRSFSGANVLTLFLYAALSGAMFLLPFEWIQVHHYTPTEAGAAFLPIVCTMAVLSPFAGRLADRIGPRLFLIAGPLLSAAGFVQLAFRHSGSYWSTFAPALFTFGIGMGLTVAPLTTTVMTSISDARHIGAGSGVNNAISRAAGLLAIATFGAVAVLIFSAALDRRLVAMNVPPQLRRAMAAQTLNLANAVPPPGIDRQMRGVIDESIRSSFQKAFEVDMIAAAILALLSSASAIAIKRPGRRTA